MRDWGVRETAGFLMCKAATLSLPRSFRKRDVPSLVALWEFARCAANSPDEVLRQYAELDADTLARLHAEHDNVARAIAGRYAARSLHYPRSWALGEGSSFLLYALVRSRRPTTVLETGVANGHSSAVILHALEANAQPSNLHSVDVAADVGALIDPAQLARWHYHQLPHWGRKRAFLDLISGLPPLDLMMHDSEHTYRWIDFELEAVLPRMSPSGLLLCDDADATYAMIDFCSRHAIEPLLLVDTIKVLGVLPLTPRVQ